MIGPCPACNQDPGFDWGICPNCGQRPGGRPAPAAAAAGVHSNERRWDETMAESNDRGTPERGHRARFSRDGDFFEPIPPGPMPRKGRLDWPGGFDSPLEDDDASDHTIMDHRGRERGDDEEDDGDHTVLIRDGHRGAVGPLAYIILRSGARMGKVYRLGRETIIGRKTAPGGRETAITIAEDAVSRRHANIRHEDGRFIFWDLASANGSFLVKPDRSRERILAPHPMEDGESIELGDVRVTFIEVDNAGSF
jgi:hypothetical protein